MEQFTYSQRYDCSVSGKRYGKIPGSYMVTDNVSGKRYRVDKQDDGTWVAWVAYFPRMRTNPERTRRDAVWAIARYADQ